VDEVVTKVPYVMTAEYLQWVIDTYKVDYVVHGDDPCIVDGKDVYEIPKKNGQFKSISRTEGISTTDIVGRMLLCTRSHHSKSFSDVDSTSTEGTPIKEMKSVASRENLSRYEEIEDSNFEYRKTDFLTTMNVIRLFGASVKPPKPTDRVVYVAGAWDMFHGAHVHLLEMARQFGDYLIVGVHNDGIINSHIGMNYPIMNMQERALSVIGCKFVDDVLIDAPYVITPTMLASLKITAVVRGSMQSDAERSDPIDKEFTITADTPMNPPRKYPYHRDPYAVPRERGILHVIPSVSGLSAAEIVDRIHEQRERYKTKFAKKKAAEEEYYKERYEVEAAEMSKNTVSTTTKEE
jgi:ethanolamine-phosphate cytidylyltransferase